MSARTVLVVEDSEAEAAMLSRALTDSVNQSNVVCVNTTTEAAGYVFSGIDSPQRRSQLPDLVVLDVKVPPLGGLAFLKLLRADERTRGIPVVMLSGALGDKDIQDLYRSGANSYLDKPSDAPQFASMVAAAAKYWLALNLSLPRRRYL